LRYELPNARRPAAVTPAEQYSAHLRDEVEVLPNRPALSFERIPYGKLMILTKGDEEPLILRKERDNTLRILYRYSGQQEPWNTVLSIPFQPGDTLGYTDADTLTVMRNAVPIGTIKYQLGSIIISSNAAEVGKILTGLQHLDPTQIAALDGAITWPPVLLNDANLAADRAAIATLAARRAADGLLGMNDIISAGNTIEGMIPKVADASAKDFLRRLRFHLSLPGSQFGW